MKTDSDSELLEQQWKEVGGSLRDRLLEQLYSQLRQQLLKQLPWQLRIRLEAPLREQSHEQQLWEQLQLEERLWQPLQDCISLESWTDGGYWFDFCTSVLNCAPVTSKWLAFKSLVEQCGWILPYEKICLVCDRPIQLSFDNEARLHAEGEAAIQFADRFSVYAYYGVRLPEQYGKIHPYQWRSQWLLEEYNAELRRVLIQGIGYERICQELQATELDSWAEYTLLKIDADVDEEPILLLKMICPSTGFIHVSRVPPDVESALISYPLGELGNRSGRICHTDLRFLFDGISLHS